ncbi:uncharacterized protein C8R40DRAFT_310 [Lentinula edodes]|uniref:uncharacterized protein n=1 Tax=Lentinula edodes TaxID=5353 RepID=UPI001E8E7879|nr:uncharacterized protein C8R40DRAFT_310 [Lentinula edodes]KAH7880853.1 hypothetical protein C8R40DRAFT_310 [Lentinula edodes]
MKLWSVHRPGIKRTVTARARAPSSFLLTSLTVMSAIPVIIDIRPTIGALFCGVIATSVFYGVTILQTIFYFQTYPDDKTFIRIVVLFVWALDTLDLFLVVNGLWTWSIANFANPLALLEVPWSINAEPVVTATISTAVHLFFQPRFMAYRIRTINQRLTPIAVIVGIVTFFSWTLGLYATIHGFTTRGSIENVTQALRWTDIGANVSAAALDVTITVTLCLQLYFSNHGFETFPKTRRIIIDVITFFAAPKTLVYYAFLCMTSKAYTNTFLAQLNARVYIRRESDKSLSNMNPSRAIVFRARQTNEIENSSMDHVSNNRRVPNFNQTYEGPASQGGQGRTMVLEKIEQLV